MAANQVDWEGGSQAAKPIVAIVDDDPIVGLLLTQIVESIGFCAVVYEQAEAFLAKYDPTAEGCVMADLSMPGMSGLELQEQLRDRGSKTPFIVCSGYGDIPTCVKAMRNGAFEFLEKPCKPEQVRSVVSSAVAADRERRTKLIQTDNLQSRLATLNEDERVTLKLLVDGAANKNIATTLDVSRRTVQYRIASLMRKLGAESRGQLISLATTASVATAHLRN